MTSAGEPLPTAVIYASSLTATRPRIAKVDHAGNFKLERLEPGLYRISAGVRGYIAATPPNPRDPILYRVGDSVTFTMIKGGVITGTVTGPNGPVVALGAFAIRVRDEAGRRLPTTTVSHERSTDDRGVYRFYGLLPGTYQVLVARSRIGFLAPSPYDNNTPTYFPSSTRDTAAEIIVREGEVATADIQYRGEPGHAISGTVLGKVEAQERFAPQVSVSVTEVHSRMPYLNAPTSPDDNLSFGIYGVPDGEYEVTASQFLPSRDELKSPPRRVTVRGADVSGVTLTLAPLASIEGRLIFESDPKADCGKHRETAAQETVVYGRRYEPEKKPDAAAKTISAPEVSVLASNQMTVSAGDAKGSFTLRSLSPGAYHIDPRPPASGWYVRSISMGSERSVAQAKLNSVLARDGVSVKSGERVSGLTVTMTEGAASLRGRVDAAEGQRLPAGMRVYLVPAEKEGAENVLRFFEADVELDGGFVVGNIAPGQYSIVARENDQRDTTISKRIREDASLRAELLREAEQPKLKLELKPCQRLIDFNFSYQMPAERD